MDSGNPAFEPCDVLVVGTGVAGLLTALKAAEFGSVVIVTKRQTHDAATRYAQGGVASVMDDSDSYESHIKDTLQAGAGLCRREVVEMVVEDGPRAIHELIKMGARFSRESGGQISLTREGGHSANRIVHYRDTTGLEIETTLARAVRSHSRIRVFENSLAVNLIGGRKEALGPGSVHGAYVLSEATGRTTAQPAKATVLATGGCGKAYLYTSNPDVATGDGIAMAYRAGARIANMEFVQFHPTCLYNRSGSRFLVSEAVRGEGGKLRNASGEEFMARYDALLELAPRDVVARAIDQEMKQSGCKHVYLDVTHLDPGFLSDRFPNIGEECQRQGIDITQEWIPIVPAAHYMCGGILVDSHGRTDLAGLYALGETSCTGVHGANRLASNSLLEALVFARRTVEDIERSDLLNAAPAVVAPWSSEGTTKAYETVLLDHDWDSVRSLLWDYVGIVRTDERLAIAQRRLAVLRDAIEGYYWRYRLSSDLVELRNLALCAELIVRSSQFRLESRGLHYTLNHPSARSTFAGDTIISRFGVPTLLPTTSPIETV